MGIYVQAYAARPLLRSAQKLAGQIASSARDWAVSSGLEELFFAGRPRANGVSICIYPPAGGIDFAIAGGRVSFGVKTSIGGPGYHRALVDLCDRLQGELGLKWRWDGDTDQTGYARHRSERILQREFASQVEAHCRFAVERKTSVKALVANLPMEFAVGADGCVGTPGGPLPFSHFERALSVHEEMSECSAYLMPWRNESGDGRFWADTLRAILWTDVEWRAPATSWESHVHQAAAACYGHLNSWQGLEFEAAMTELGTLAGSPAGTLRPAAEGIGWKRRLRGFQVTGPWRVNLPGYYVHETVDESTDCIRFADEEIRGSSFVIKTTTQEPLDWREGFQDSPEIIIGDDIHYRICSELAPLPDREGWFMASAEYHTMREGNTHQILLLSLYAEEKKIRERIEEVAGGVWFDATSEYESVPLTE